MKCLKFFSGMGCCLDTFKGAWTSSETPGLTENKLISLVKLYSSSCFSSHLLVSCRVLAIAYMVVEPVNLIIYIPSAFFLTAAPLDWRVGRENPSLDQITCPCPSFPVLGNRIMGAVVKPLSAASLKNSSCSCSSRTLRSSIL